MTTPAPRQASIGTKPLWRRHQFWRVVLPVVSIACAIVAALLVYNAFVGTNAVPQSSSGFVAKKKTPPPPTVKLPAEAKTVARRFIKTAVARKNLREAYWFSGPGIREGMTLKQWLSGNIAVVPYTVTGATSARLAVDQSYAKSAKLEILLYTPKHKPGLFFMDLKKHPNGKWTVESWVPRAAPPVPIKQ